MIRMTKMYSGALTFVLLLAFVVGCATSETKSSSGSAATSTRSGFLSDYERLNPVEGMEGAEEWLSSGVDWKKYNKVWLQLGIIEDPAAFDYQILGVSNLFSHLRERGAVREKQYGIVSAGRVCPQLDSDGIGQQLHQALGKGCLANSSSPTGDYYDFHGPPSTFWGQ